MKKTIYAVLSAITLAVLGGTLFAAPKKNKNFGKKSVVLISREEGSGTRGAFVELFGIEMKNAEGKKVDFTSEEADITNSTEVMLTSVAGNKYAIGYVSLGSLNKTVKALKIEGVSPSVSSIKNGTYKISRPFNIVTKQTGLSENASDFIRFILSSDGQAIVEANGYISATQNPAYIATGKKGKITVAGSSSVTPVMEKLAEAYEKLNPEIKIEVQMSDSTTGVNSALNGVCEIGMASRELKDSEKAKGALQIKIAIDGIAVIINKENPTESASIQSVKDLYIGTISKWGDVK
ncbi:MAG: substrate-binding domain-containing protein [Treponema succinifaciens]|uniref:substrate-binding domain-containing protein n=1 Tax=Treponema TaxID=157 RepID=UPI00235680C6|nr:MULTISPECIES: substrate-binding domain-containing protein [Treponema]MCI6913572.1 substrate-binding domain-containing protein [Treponema succinifaciens]MDD6962642.1 substrate-binding domain-containing protein [Treponema succinifaciens]MDY2615417.1 substrate-binding domain-containing protein [Treponema succinifaciens]MDY5117403.1 substrate-binding domain-containing protein [Treponema succinifaciens]